MKVYLSQLNTQVRKNLAPAYLISGDIPVLVNEADTIIKCEAKKQSFTEILSYPVDSTFTWDTLEAILAHDSLFQEKQVICLRIRNLPLKNIASGHLIRYLNHPNPNKLLILITPKLNPKDASLQWVKMLIKIGIHIPIWPLEGFHYQQWIQSKFQEKKLSVDSDVVKQLTEYTEGNYAAALQTIEKLALAYPNESIHLNELMQIVMQEAHYDLFHWVDYCLTGHKNKMLKAFQSLKNTGIEPTLLLWTMTQTIRKLIFIDIQKQRDVTLLPRLFKKLGIWEKKQSLFEKALNRHTQNSLENLLETAYQTDKVLKAGMISYVWDSLSQLALELAS